jgi:ComF family protein
LCEAQSPDQIDLCPACRADLPWIRDHCTICSIPLAGGQTGLCGKCLHVKPVYCRCVAAFEYRYPIDKLIINFKSNGQLIVGKVLASLAADVIAQRYRNNSLPDLMIPVPLHGSALRERGFNQSLEIADVLSDRLSIPVNSHSCRRNRKTSAQKSLSIPLRYKNLQKAFSVNSSFDGMRIVIIDDVVTTGSTVESLAALLLSSGATEVHVWSLARTPEPSR